jgi:tetraacyldisaccharide 4'-kinase
VNTEQFLYDPQPGLWRRSLSSIYGAAVRFHVGLYRTGFLKPQKLDARIICVGNLTVGGSGKTPTVAMIARGLSRRGRRVGILSRGYRGRNTEPVNVVSDGQTIFLGPTKAGDEAYYLARLLPDIPVLTGRNRGLVGREAIKRFNLDTLIMDDGYQHLNLARDVNLLLVDALQPWGNGHLLPAGPLREDRRAAERADAFLLTRSPQPQPASIREIKQDFPDRPVFSAHHHPVRLKSLDGDRIRDIGYLKNRRILAFCGLARPLTFLNTLTELGADVALMIRWPDHYQPTSSDLALIETKAEELGVHDCLTTAKDEVKLGGRPIGLHRNLNVWVLEVEMKLWDNENEFWDVLTHYREQTCS